MKKLLPIILVFVVVSLINVTLVGCSSNKTSTTATTTSGTASLQEATVLIGTDSPLTGPASPWGLSVEHGVQLAFDDVNAAGGLTVGNTHYTFKVISLDDQFDTATATNNIRQLVYQNGCKYIFTMQSEGTLATAAEMSQQKILDFSCVDNDQVISQPANSYVFRTYDPFSLQATAYFKWLLTQYPDAKTVGLITTNSDNGLAIEDQEKAGAQANGLTFLDTVLYDSGTKDFTPFLTKMLAEKPDILTFTGAPTGDCAVLVKTAFDMGYKGHIALSTDAASDMLPIAGEAALEGVTDTNLAMQAPYVTSTVLGLPAREVAKWGASYVSTWDFYSQALIMFDAMKAANSVDTTAVKTILQDPTREWTYAALSGGLATFDSPMAQQWFGANATNQILDAWAICKIHNGQDFIATIINP